MNVVVISCLKYSDTWSPFIALFERFFGGPLTLLTDRTDGRDFPGWVTVHTSGGTWCQILANYAKEQTEPFILMQDDFFISEPVQHSLIQEAFDEQKRLNAGCVRIYPCPGGDIDYGHPHYSEVSKNAMYKISCMAAVWRPDYVEKVARFSAQTPVHFEIMGRKQGKVLPDKVLAFKRHVQPWPIEYICSAITKGKWNPDAIKLCYVEGIPIDTSRRPILAA